MRFNAAEALAEVVAFLQERGFESRHPSGNEQGKGDDTVEVGYSFGELTIKVFEDSNRTTAFRLNVISTPQLEAALKRLSEWMTERGHL